MCARAYPVCDGVCNKAMHTSTPLVKYFHLNHDAAAKQKKWFFLSTLLKRSTIVNAAISIKHFPQTPSILASPM